MRRGGRSSRGFCRSIRRWRSSGEVAGGFGGQGSGSIGPGDADVPIDHTEEGGDGGFCDGAGVLDGLVFGGGEGDEFLGLLHGLVAEDIGVTRFEGVPGFSLHVPDSGFVVVDAGLDDDGGRELDESVAGLLIFVEDFGAGHVDAEEGVSLDEPEGAELGVFGDEDVGDVDSGGDEVAQVLEADEGGAGGGEGRGGGRGGVEEEVGDHACGEENEEDEDDGFHGVGSGASRRAPLS